MTAGAELTAGEEALGLAMFLVKLPVRLVPFLFGVGAVVGLCAAIYLFFLTFQDESATVQAYWIAYGVLGLGLLPFLVYVGFSLAFGKSFHGLIGIPATFFMFSRVGAQTHPELAATIPLILFALFQLKFYALVLWRTTGTIPTQLKLMYLSDRDELRYSPEEHELIRLERQLTALWAAIEKSLAAREFRPSPSRLCNWCDHKALCPAYGGTPPPFPDEHALSFTIDRRTERPTAD